jgi:hypothetical protein
MWFGNRRIVIDNMESEEESGARREAEKFARNKASACTDTEAGRVPHTKDMVALSLYYGHGLEFVSYRGHGGILQTFHNRLCP